MLFLHSDGTGRKLNSLYGTAVYCCFPILKCPKENAIYEGGNTSLVYTSCQTLRKRPPGLLCEDTFFKTFSMSALALERDPPSYLKVLLLNASFVHPLLAQEQHSKRLLQVFLRQHHQRLHIHINVCIYTLYIYVCVYVHIFVRATGPSNEL